MQRSVASAVSDSLWFYALWLARLLCTQDSPGQNTAVGFQYFSRDLLNPGIESGPPALQADSLLSESPRKPKKGNIYLHNFPSLAATNLSLRIYLF